MVKTGSLKLFTKQTHLSLNLYFSVVATAGLRFSPIEHLQFFGEKKLLPLNCPSSHYRVMAVYCFGVARVQMVF